MLGGFEVDADGQPVPETAWKFSRAKDLVKVLALAPGHRLPRDAVVEALWPQLDVDAGMANLHKAAHHARRALGENDAVVLREGMVLLAPGASVETDVEAFEATGDPSHYGGELLPDDRYDEWTEERRDELRTRYLDALRAAGLWERLAEEDPGDEPAQRAVMRARLATGDRAGALRAFSRLRGAQEELGVEPDIETLTLHARIAGGAALGQALAGVEVELAEAPLGRRPELLVTRAELLLAIGDRGAPAAFAEAAAAAGAEGFGLRVRQAWAQLASGDPAAAHATLAPLAPRSEGERAVHLIAQAAAAWYARDPSAARAAAAEALPLAVAAGLEREARTAIQIQAMVAHSVGRWPEKLALDLYTSLRSPDLAETLFDGHLCVAEYALASGEPLDRLRTIGEELAANALRLGARRAQTLAATMLGEIALITGDADAAAEHLREGVRLSRDIGSITAEALATVRLGEAEHARGGSHEGEVLLADGVVIAAWAPSSDHLKPLAHAALLRATGDAELGLERLDGAEAAMRGEILCANCQMVFQLAASIAASRSSQPERAALMLSAAEGAAALLGGEPWPGSLDEARAELGLARGDLGAAHSRFRAAEDAFVARGRHLDAHRVRARLGAFV